MGSALLCSFTSTPLNPPASGGKAREEYDDNLTSLMPRRGLVSKPEAVIHGGPQVPALQHKGAPPTMSRVVGYGQGGLRVLPCWDDRSAYSNTAMTRAACSGLTTSSVPLVKCAAMFL